MRSVAMLLSMIKLVNGRSLQEMTRIRSGLAAHVLDAILTFFRGRYSGRVLKMSSCGLEQSYRICPCDITKQREHMELVYVSLWKNVQHAFLKLIRETCA